MLLVVALHRVGVAHQHHGRAGVAFAESPHHGQHLHEADAGRQRAVAGLLDHGSIGRGVGEGHAELDDVGTCFGHALHELGRDVGEGEAGGDIGDQRLAALGLEFGEGLVDAAHLAWPPLTVCPRMEGRS